MVSPTLESVRTELEAWRGTRAKSGRIPNRVWSAALQLLTKHSTTKICKTLGLSPAQFKKKATQQAPLALQKDTPFYEVRLPSIPPKQPTMELGASIKLKRPDGTLVSINHLSESLLVSVITSIMRGC